MFCFPEDEHQLVDTVDFVLDTLDQRSKCIGDVVDKGVRNPVGGDIDVIFELFNSMTDILRVRRGVEVELECIISRITIAERSHNIKLADKIPSLNTIMYMFNGSRCVGL